MKSSPVKLAYLVSHPIQYQAPLLRRIAQESDIDLTVFFLSDFSVRAYSDEGFGRQVSWDVPLLEGYRSEVLPGEGNDKNIVPPFRPRTKGIRKRLKEGEFEALWLHGYAHVANLKAIAAARQLGIKTLVRAESQMASAEGEGVVRFTKELLIRRVFSRVNAFLTIGTVNREYYERYGVPSERMFTVPYAVDNCRFQNMVSEAASGREALRKSLELDPSRPIILFASKFIKRKRAGDLLEAYIKLSPDGKTEPKPYLLFIGDGEEREALERRAQSKEWSSIRFLGFKNQRELPAYFDLCDVFVLVSEREPWGLIVNEVMNAGKPVIVTDEVGSARDLVADGVNGYVLKVAAIDELADRLQKLLADDELVKRMGAESLKRIRSWDYEADVQGLRSALAYVLPGRLSG